MPRRLDDDHEPAAFDRRSDGRVRPARFPSVVVFVGAILPLPPS